MLCVNCSVRFSITMTLLIKGKGEERLCGVLNSAANSHCWKIEINFFWGFASLDLSCRPSLIAIAAKVVAIFSGVRRERNEFN